MANQNAEVMYTPDFESGSKSVQLAAGVEKARRDLFDLLLRDGYAGSLLVRQVLADIGQGYEFSDIFLVRDEVKHLLYRLVVECRQQGVIVGGYHPEPKSVIEYGIVQKSEVVQFIDQLDDGLFQVSSNAIEIMYRLHFLPVYLIETSERIRNRLALSERLDAGYKVKLHATSHELKHLRQQMIAYNTGLVAYIAHKYKTDSLAFEDLMQEGIIGLIKAVDRFDPQRGNSFSTYAVFWIKQAISRLIVKQDKVVSLPMGLAEKSSPVFEAMRNTYRRSERWPTLAELKESCDLTEQEIKTISCFYRATSMSDNLSNDEDDVMVKLERMPQEQFGHPLEELVKTDLVGFIDQVVATLPEKQARILAMRFGLRNHTEMTLQAVADHLHVTRERVRQIQNDALNKLKQQFGFDLVLFLEPTDV